MTRQGTVCAVFAFWGIRCGQQIENKVILDFTYYEKIPMMENWIGDRILNLVVRIQWHFSWGANDEKKPVVQSSEGRVFLSKRYDKFGGPNRIKHESSKVW